MIFDDFPRLSRGTLSIVLDFYGIKNVHAGLLDVFTFGKIELVGTADIGYSENDPPENSVFGKCPLW